MNQNPFEAMGRRIRQRRMELGLSQQQLSEAVNATVFAPGIGQTMISSLEVGREGVRPSIQLFAALCVVLDTSADYLLGLSSQAAGIGLDRRLALLAEDDEEQARAQAFFAELQQLPAGLRRELLYMMQMTARGLVVTHQRNQAQELIASAGGSR